ncbi:MAG: histidinol-phosphatase HisJ family protein [Actinomycetota bacterium]
MSDYHLHLHPHFGDREGPPLGDYPEGLIESYVEAAAGPGVTELGFTEHLYRTAEGMAVLGPFWESETREDLADHTRRMVAEDAGLSLDRYVEEVVAARDRGLPVRLGLEVDFFPTTIDRVLELLAGYPFDFLIGSVHWVGGWSIDSAEVVYEFERRGVDLAWEDYFNWVTELAAAGVVDSLAHVDVCKKFGVRPETEPVHLYDLVVTAAAASGTAVEVSSQGLRRPVQEIYPSPRFLRMFFEAGVDITLASDAHIAPDAGFAHELVVEAAKAAGYHEHLRFDRRRRYLVPLT